MPATNTTNLQLIEIMNTEARVNFAQKFNVKLQGVAELDPSVPAGEFINVRGWNAMTGDAEVMVDGGTYATNALSTYKDTGVILRRIYKVGVEDVGRFATGMDGNQAGNVLIPDFFLGEVQNRFLNVLEALTDLSSGILRTTNRLDVFADHATVGRGYLSTSNAATAMGKVGDNMFAGGAWWMHSATYNYLFANKYLESSPNTSAYGADSSGNVITFMGKPIIQSDFCTKITGTYANRFRTYLLGPGALYLGIQRAMNAEHIRDSNKVDIISTDMHFCAHARGCKYVGVANPSNVVLATPASFSLAYSSPKFVRIVALDHNNPDQ